MADAEVSHLGEVDEVVGLQELFVAGALCEHSDGGPQPPVGRQFVPAAEPGQQRPAVVDRAPLESEARLERPSRGDPVAVFDPRAAPRADQRRFELVGEADSSPHARPVGLGDVAVTGARKGDAASQTMQLEAGVEQMPRGCLD